MSRRKKTLAVIRREYDGYVPYTFSLTPQQQEKFHDLFYEWDYQNLFSLSYQFISNYYDHVDVDFGTYYDKGEISYDHYFDDFGVARLRSDYFNLDGVRHPLKYATAKSLDNYPFPKVEHYRWEETINHLNEVVHNNSVAVGYLAMTLFETSWALRGYKKFLQDIEEDNEFFNKLLDILTKIRLKHAKKYAQIGVDVLHLGDDLTDKNGLLFSTEQWQTKFKPRYAEIIAEARRIKPDILIEFHCEGNVTELIPDLIEIGVDMLNPIEPESVNPFELKEKFGDKISFRGGLSVINTLPNGTVKEVHDECMKLIRDMSTNGGFILSPAQSIDVSTPWVNFEAYLRTVKGYNRSKK